MEKLLKRPDLYLQDINKKSEEIKEKIISLHTQMEEALIALPLDEKVILFRNETLKIKAFRYINVIPKPHYFIRGMEFITMVNHNGCFNDKLFFNTPIGVRIILEYDFDSTNYNISKEKENTLRFNSPLQKLIFEEKEYENEKYGVIERPSDRSFDTEIQIEDFSDFIKLKGIFEYGCKKIGLPNYGSSATNENIKEL